MKKKSDYIFVVITLVGLAFLGMLFVYYGFYLGVKPCKGLSSDLQNCGDADLGGVVFLLLGVPLTLIGIVGFIISRVLTFVKNRRQ